MKRLYILGNGFDVAHKLPTAYLDYRKFLKGSIENKDFCIRMEDTYGLGENTDYWWKEFDTYKVGTVANSCSTMHKIAEKEFALEDFSTDQL